MVSVRLDSETEKRPDELAKATGRSKSHHVRQAVIEYLDEYADCFIALSRLEQQPPRVPLGELEQELDLNGEP